MKELIIYIITFIVAYLFYLVFVLNRKDVLMKFPNGKEMSYLKYRYKIKINDNNLKKVARKVCLANSFILSTTVYVISLFDNLFIQIIVGVLTILILILGIYHLIGIYYKKKQGGKHV